jgi:hypothetical protein
VAVASKVNLKSGSNVPAITREPRFWDTLSQVENVQAMINADKGIPKGLAQASSL